MSLLVLFDSKGTGEGGVSVTAPSPSGLLQAILDAIHGSDDQIGGMRMTRLLEPLLVADVSGMQVESTLGFGSETEGSADAKLLVGGEIITATTRLDGPANFRFGGLARGLEGSTAKLHPPGTLVFDLSKNQSAIDHATRGLFVATALGADLDVIGRNLGLKKCAGLTDDQWRAIIQAVAYLPKQAIDAFERALTALLGAGNFTVSERISEPYRVFVAVLLALSASVRGRFLLNSGERQITNGASTVTSDYPPLSPALSDTLTELGRLEGDPLGSVPALVVEGRSFSFLPSGTGTAAVSVVDDTPITRRGARGGFPNYFLPGGSVLGTSITMGTSPGAAGTPVLVDYTAFSAHYLPRNEAQLDDGDVFPYLADPLLAARCLLDQVRPAGVQVVLSTLLP